MNKLMEKQTFINEMTCNFNLREPKAKKPTNIYFIVCIEGLLALLCKSESKQRKDTQTDALSLYPRSYQCSCSCLHLLKGFERQSIRFKIS